MKSKSLMIILFALLFTGSSYAQMSGNPAGVRGKGELTIGVDATYMTQGQGDETAITRRFFARGEWGVLSWMDLYGLLGAVQLEMRPGNKSFTNYKDDLKFAFGLGFNAAFPSPALTMVSFWLSGQAMRFASEGSFESMGTTGTQGYSQEFAMKYDWRELRGSTGIMFNMSFLRLYAGLTGWVIQRLDDKTEYLISGGDRIYVANEEGEYRSGFWWAGMGGIEIMLPKRYSIGVEMTYFNSSNYFLVIGITQTGFLTW